MPHHRRSSTIVHGQKEYDIYFEILSYKYNMINFDHELDFVETPNLGVSTYKYIYLFLLINEFP